MNKPTPANLQSPIALAYIGDSVFEILVRTRLVMSDIIPIRNFTNVSKNYLSARAQSQMYYSLQDFLDEDERDILRRGRNANPNSKAKNASVAEYRNATGVESLFGYLYLSEKYNRIMELFDICWQTSEGVLENNEN